MKTSELETPALVLDLAALDANLHRMRDRAMAAGKQLRPHFKTHKCSHLARRQLEVGPCVGGCVAKLSEAEVLINAGIDEILITSPVVAAEKMARLVDAVSGHPKLLTAVDNFDHALAFDRLARHAGIRLPVVMDVNPDMGRTGVNFADAGSLARQLAALPGLELRGIQCYAGNLQHLADFTERAKKSRSVLGRAAKLLRELRRDGLPLPIFTGAGTGTSEIDFALPELTDLQVGSYCVMDAEYAAIGGETGTLGELYHPALKVLTEVVSCNQPDFVTVDAGLKALYFTPAAPPLVMQNGRMRTDYRYQWFGDEHGRLYFPGVRPALGTRFELCLPHCDPTVNLYDNIFVAADDAVVDCWPVDLRGCVR